MYYYNILPTRNIGGNLAILTFSSQKTLEIGQVVAIEIRKSDDFGMVISQNLEIQQKMDILDINQDSDVISKFSRVGVQLAESTPIHVSYDETQKLNKNIYDLIVKKQIEILGFEVSQILSDYPAIVTKAQREFLQSFTTNTFNSPNDVWSSIFQPYKILTQKQIKSLEFKIQQKNENFQNLSPINAKFETLEKDLIKYPNQIIKVDNKAPIVEFILDPHIVIRIMYIIRNKLSSFQGISNHFSSPQLLFIFPEKKYLEKIMANVLIELKKDKSLINTQFLKYAGDVTKSSKEAIWELLNHDNSKVELQIIFSTRSGIFLPFQKLSHIVLIDEGNSLYIQDQNSLYFDTRDVVFLLHKAYGSDLTFLSTLPSIRLHSFYKSKGFEATLDNPSEIIKTLPKLRITHLEKKSAKFGLFGYEIEQILKPDVDTAFEINK